MTKTRNPQRILSNRYQVVPRTIILLIKDDRVLLQKAPVTKKLWPGKYNGIGGHVERNEDLYTGAHRELMEEAGVICSNLSLAGFIMIDVEESQGILMFVFTGDEIGGKLRESEEGTLHWIDISKLSEFQAVEDIPELVTLVQKSKDSGKIFSGNYFYTNEGVRKSTIIWD